MRLGQLEVTVVSSADALARGCGWGEGRLPLGRAGTSGGLFCLRARGPGAIGTAGPRGRVGCGREVSTHAASLTREHSLACGPRASAVGTREAAHQGVGPPKTRLA